MRRRYKPLAQWAIRFAASIIGRTLPLSSRKALVASRMCRKLRGAGFEFSMGILHDLRRRDPDALHRFLWSNHLAYATSYEIQKRFEASNLNPSRRILFNDIRNYFHSRGLDSRNHIRSVFEVGCSMGYLLRHLEEEVCPSAEILHGLDIDAYAVETGSTHLSSLRSKVKLFTADMAAAGRVMGNQNYDLVLCCGVLMYVNEKTAENVVRVMLSHASRLVAMICLANAEPHRIQSGSITRSSDGAFVHDVSRMIRDAGGKVIGSKWVGTETSGSSPSYLILAEPQRGHQSCPA
jgi:SAM-dependent methyltransferase